MELATSDELESALAGNDPDDAIAANVATLQTIYEQRSAFGPTHRRVTDTPTPAQIAASSPGDIWTQVA